MTAYRQTFHQGVLLLLADRVRSRRRRERPLSRNRVRSAWTNYLEEDQVIEVRGNIDVEKMPRKIHQSRGRLAFQSLIEAAERSFRPAKL
jgi:hypothetical protein